MKNIIIAIGVIVGIIIVFWAVMMMGFSNTEISYEPTMQLSIN